MKKNEKEYKFWRDYGIPIFVVLIGLVLYFGYNAWDLTMTVERCNEVATSWRDKYHGEVESKKVYFFDEEVENVFNDQRYNSFCAEKGFEYGFISSSLCDGVNCYIKNKSGQNELTMTKCYNFKQYLMWVEDGKD